MKELIKCRKFLLEKSQQEIYGYFVPKLWNLFNFKKVISETEEAIEVNPYSFYLAAIDYLIKNKKHNCKSKKSLSNSLGMNNDGGEWIKNSIIYSMQIRTSTTFNHDLLEKLDKNFFKTGGTFLKTIGLIPYLLHLGINLLYILPINKISRIYQKGELGSPYSIEDPMGLEPELSDPLISQFSIDQQFLMLVEALHLSGIRIALDFIPRTSARNSALLMKHPEWFYYIKKTNLDKYIAPPVKSLSLLTVPNPKHGKSIYREKEIIDFIELFEVDPRTKDRKSWSELINSFDGSNSFLEHLENITGLTVAPAFADVINDPQPAWNDITYLRMYLDHPISAQKWLKKKYPPYILFDVAKSSLNPGKIPNLELWNWIISIIPSFQKRFGIDAARIDMGHALPEPLNRGILSAARRIDPSIAFIAEELDNNRAKEAMELGYNLIIGDGFYKLPRVREFLFHEYVYGATNYPLPLLAQVESHDTPRILGREGGDIMARFMLAFNLFIPNTIPFINSGQELKELQPMNLGLDCLQSDLYRLADSHPYKNKLALFDKFGFSYNSNSIDFIGLLNILTTLRLVVRSDKSMPLGFLHMREHGVGFAYLHQGFAYLVIGHTNFRDSENLTVRFDNVKKALSKEQCFAQIIYSNYEIARTIYCFNFDGSLNLWMQPGEIKIIRY